MVANPPSESGSLEQFSNAKFLSLETFRKNGEGVRTPTFFAKFDGLLFISTISDTEKVKRLRMNDRVRVAPSDFRGHAKGEWVEGRARPVESADVIKRVNLLLNKQHPFLRRLRALREIFSKKAKRLVYSIRIDDLKKSDTV
jgi:uncharacterized protein